MLCPALDGNRSVSYIPIGALYQPNKEETGMPLEPAAQKQLENLHVYCRDLKKYCDKADALARELCEATNEVLFYVAEIQRFLAELQEKS
ncbi:hypothetical protein D6833_06385 [Candidatus Parcubacteria bacterium]|nr:MAG: hypothetical protein D6833_06385 [Candidatus Parcubacteria bacterium]